MADTAIWNFRQLAHHELDGFGGIGEGMSIQIAKDGRRILWLAHESAPKNFTGVDVSDPRGVHQLWFADGDYIHMSSGAPDFVPSHPKDDQFYRIIDVKNPTKPVEVGRWWLPGTREGDSDPPPARHPEG